MRKATLHAMAGAAFVPATALVGLWMLAGGLFLADEKSWPQPGDNIFVSVTLPGPASGTSRWTSDVEACTPVTLQKQAGVHQFIVGPARDATITLYGDWTGRMFQSEAECDFEHHTGLTPDVQRCAYNVYILGGSCPPPEPHEPLHVAHTPRVGDIVYSPVLQMRSGEQTVMGKDHLSHRTDVSLAIPACSPLKITAADPVHLAWTFSPKELEMDPDFGWSPPKEWLTLRGNWRTGAPPEMYQDARSCGVAMTGYSEQ
jgi:hypothetical protein